MLRRHATRSLRVGWLLFSCAAGLGNSNCSPSPPRGETRPPAESPRRPSKTRVALAFENQLAAPYRLFALEAVVGGQDVALPLPRPGETVERAVELGSEAHEIALLARVRVESGRHGEQCEIAVGFSDTFRLAHDSVKLAARLYLRDGIYSIVERVDLSLRLTGAIPAPASEVGAEFDDGHCSALSIPERATCRVQAAIDDARAAHDVVRLMCYRDVGASIAGLVIELERLEKSLETSGTQKPSPEDERTRRALTERIRRLSDDLARCGSVDLEAGRAVPRRIVKPGCDETDSASPDRLGPPDAGG